MLVDLRYHIVTIVIIFVTLAIGILIGSTMVGNDLIIRKQKNLISRLEQDFTELRTENREFKAEISSLKERLTNNFQFQKMILPLVVEGQLEDKNLLLLAGDDISTEMKEKVIQTLNLAGVKKLKLTKDKITDNENINKVLLLGEVKDKFKKEDEEEFFKEKLIVIDAKQLNSISGLIKMVFQVAAKDLEKLRRVSIE